MKPSSTKNRQLNRAVEGNISAHAQSLFDTAQAMRQSGQLKQALSVFHQFLKLHPFHFDALFLGGVTAAMAHQFNDAVDLLGRAVKINPNHEGVRYNLGNALNDLGQPHLAIKSFDRAISLNPNHYLAYAGRGNAFRKLMNHQTAIESYDRALAIRPDYADALYNRGNAQKDLQQFESAVHSYDRAIAINPLLYQAHSNRGTALFNLKRYQDALASIERSIDLQPNFSEAYFNRGNVFRELQQYQLALADFSKAISLKPDDFQAYLGRGLLLSELKQQRAALLDLEFAMTLSPGIAFLLGTITNIQGQVCDWNALSGSLEKLFKQVQAGKKVVLPFCILAMTSSLVWQRRAAEIFVAANCAVDQALGPSAKVAKGKKICLGYYSADFHNHATTLLMAELFERHDRNRFELVAFSFGPDSDDEMRVRTAAAFDRFIDVRLQSDADVARLSRALGIDIAVDLKGFTQDSRPGIFSYRAAPLQVNYLGYPGTMGADYIDYLIADKTLIPQESQQHYAEKIVYLPNSYQVNDSKRQISDRVFTRAELGLPDSGFVYCCFNNNYKIMPGTFDGWMRILKQVDGSVLWLLADNDEAASNLCMHAQERGLDPNRLVFARRMSLPEHLARHRLADLFLDTLPCNAHTTASDALWAGLPVLTCCGEAFASRVAASLLAAIDLPELITTSQEAYEAMAVELAGNTERLHAIKQKLEHNRLTTPLFDCRLFTKHIEDAYTQMYERYHADRPPEHMEVRP